MVKLFQATGQNTVSSWVLGTFLVFINLDTSATLRKKFIVLIKWFGPGIQMIPLSKADYLRP